MNKRNFATILNTSLILVICMFILGDTAILKAQGNESQTIPPLDAAAPPACMTLSGMDLGP